MTGSGDTFAKKDGNIAAGLPVEDAVNQIFKAMMLKRIEYIIGSFSY